MAKEIHKEIADVAKNKGIEVENVSYEKNSGEFFAWAYIGLKKFYTGGVDIIAAGDRHIIYGICGENGDRFLDYTHLNEGEIEPARRMIEGKPAIGDLDVLMDAEPWRIIDIKS
jgi:hypothetical protein